MDPRKILVGGAFLAALALALLLPHGTTTTQAAVPAAILAGQELTATAVAEHAASTDCWTVIDGKVYDVTTYIPRHPGGVAEISEVCGTDGTALFTTSAGRQHSQNAHAILAAYYIGDLGGAVDAAALEAVQNARPPAGEEDDDDEWEDEWEDEWDD